MVKIKDSRKLATKLISSKKMEIGDIGIIHGNEYPGHLILKSYDGLVSLTDPECTWNKKDTEFSIELVDVEIRILKNINREENYLNGDNVDLS